MTRATRFSSYAAAFTVSYFLVWFSVLPVPLIAEETKDQILPLVRALPNTRRIATSLFDSRRLVVSVFLLASVVGAGVARVLFAGIAGMGVVVV